MDAGYSTIGPSTQERLMTHPPAAPAPATPAVLVLGANGRFGAAAVRAFHAAGWRVIAQARRPLAAGIAQLATRAAVDPADTAALATATGGGVSVVIHALNPPYDRWATEALPLARAAIAAARARGATLIMPGNVYNFGEDMPTVLTEETPQRARTRKGLLRIEIEEALRAASLEGVRCAVLRAGDFFGGGTGSWFDLALVKSLRRGRFTYPGPLDVVHAWAALPELAAACVALAARADGLAPFSVHHFEGHAVTGRELADAVQAVAVRRGLLPAGGRLKIGGLPWGLMRVLSPFVPAWRELVEMAYLWRRPHRLDGTRLRALTGAPAETPLHDAVDAALAELGFFASGAPTRETGPSATVAAGRRATRPLLRSRAG
jgi:nucleoside-diphosphate-sugar epimerase